MTFNRSVMSIMLSIISLFFCMSAQACYYFNGSSAPGRIIVDFGHITVPNDADAPVGTVLATKQGTMQSFGGIPAKFSCGQDSQYNISESMKISGDQTTTSDEIYSTNIQGLGVKIYYYSAVAYASEPTTPMVLYTTFTYHLGQGNVSTYQNPNAAIKIELIKTASISEMAASGLVSSDFHSLMKAESTDLLDLNIKANVEAPACSVDSSINKSINLGNVFDKDIPNVGSVANKKKVDINITCSSTVEVNMTVTGKENEDIKGQGIIALTNNNGQDPGVGAQILYQNVPVSLNTNIIAGAGLQGENSLQLALQYYRTKEKVEIGPVNGVFTVNFIYK